MKRTHNEDYFSLIEDEQLFLVADGMGGHASGEVASKMAAETISEFYQRTKDEDATWPFKMDRSLSYIENRLVCSIKLANLRIFETSCRDIRYKGMGTTIVSCLVAGDKAYVGHVGDSRVYRLREGGITQLTRDHSLLEDYKEAKPDMTEEEERNFPHKNVITRALGLNDAVEVDLRTYDLKSGDRYLFCSDGLSGHLDDDEMLEVTKDTSDLTVAVGELVDRANAAGGADNITVVLVHAD
jgi:protein phosphatase